MRRSRRLLLAMLVSVIVLGDGATRIGAQRSQPEDASLGAGCSVTEPVTALPPPDLYADPFGSGPWYVNHDRTIWAASGAWKAGATGNKVLWIRPAGASFSVIGRLLDSRSEAALTFEERCCYPTGFQSSRLYFPVPGCWEINAQSGKSSLTFIARVP
jgi:hypothetical protein